MSSTTSCARERDVLPERAGSPDISLRALSHLASPIFVANLAVMGSVTIDTIMAGRIGAEHLAAVAVGSACSVLTVMSIIGILQGLSPIAGHHYGARRYERIGFELIQNGWLGVVLAVIGAWIMLQTDFWTHFGRVQGDVASMTALFLIASAAGLPGSIGARTFIAVNAAVSRPRVTMWVSLGMLVTKIPLNAVFMYGLFGMPAMGGAGAGVAGAINAWLSFAVFFIVWKKSTYYDAMRPARFYLPSLPALLQQLRLGIPIGLCTFFEVSSFTLMAIFVARLGTIPVAAHQIVSNITATLYMVPLSLGIAVSVLVSQCLGAGAADKAREITVRTLKVSVCIACIGAVSLYMIRTPLIALYTIDQSVRNLGGVLLLFGVVYHVFDAMQTVSSFALRGYRVTLIPMVIYGVLLWAVGLGGGYWAGFSATDFGGPYGAYGFWGATAVGLMLAGTSLSGLALYVSKVKAREQKEH